MEFPESQIEKKIRDSADKLIGSKDDTLNAVYKLSLLKEMELVDDNYVNRFLKQISMTQKIEKEYYNEIYQLSMNDISSNIIADERKEDKQDTESVIPEPERGES